MVSNTRSRLKGFRRVLPALALLAAAGTASAQALPDYLLHAGDQIEISVWKEVDMQRITAIRPDGKFSFPLAGEVNAAGKTVEQVHQELVDKLKPYIPEPVVTVSVKEFDGNKAYVIGQVAKPGAIGMNPSITVLQALSIAGGLTPFAASNDIIVIRGSVHDQKVYKFHYAEMAKGNNLQQNISLVAGDVVLVP